MDLGDADEAGVRRETRQPGRSILLGVPSGGGASGKACSVNANTHREVFFLALASIRFEPEAWPRFNHDPERVAMFASIFAERGAAALDPLEVVGEENLLADGVHRVLAAEEAGLTELQAVRIDVPEGDDPLVFTYLRAVLASTGGHKELSRAERQAGIRRLLRDTDMGDAEIAEIFGVARQTVWRLRRPVADATPQPEPDAGEEYLVIEGAEQAAARLFRGLEKVFSARGLGVWDAITRDHTGERLARVLEDAYGEKALDRAECFRDWCEEAIDRLVGGRS